MKLKVEIVREERRTVWLTDEGGSTCFPIATNADLDQIEAVAISNWDKYNPGEERLYMSTVEVKQD